MPKSSFHAHFDGKSIQLDEPMALEPNTPLLITVIATEGADEAFVQLGFESLSKAYGEDEPEYPLSMIREPNADYDEGR